MDRSSVMLILSASARYAQRVSRSTETQAAGVTGTGGMQTAGTVDETTGQFAAYGQIGITPILLLELRP